MPQPGDLDDVVLVFNREDLKGVLDCVGVFLTAVQSALGSEPPGRRRVAASVMRLHAAAPPSWVDDDEQATMQGLG